MTAVTIHCLRSSVLLSCLLVIVNARPEEGVRYLRMIQDDSDEESSLYLAGFSKSMYKNSVLTLEITCTPGLELTLEWGIRSALCANEFIGYDVENFDSLNRMFQSVDKPVGMALIDEHFYLKSDVTANLLCPSLGTVVLPNYSDRLWRPLSLDSPSEYAVSKDEDTKGEDEDYLRPPGLQVIGLQSTTPVLIPGALVKIPSDGNYMFILFATYDGSQGNITALVRTFGPYGYLSAIDWPLLHFYGVMTAVYIILVFGWTSSCFIHRQDLLTLHYLIGAVGSVGLIEKLALFGEYVILNQTGHLVFGAVIVDELVSVGRPTLFRAMLMVASIGFGSVKEGHDRSVILMTAIGVVYFVLSSLEFLYGSNEKEKPLQPDGPDELMWLLIAKAITDAGIYILIVTVSSRNTKRTSLKRYPNVRVPLYRRFTLLIDFSILVSFVFVVWSVVEHKRAQCLTDWKDMWVDEAFWHVISSIVLFTIMILFRPSAINKSFSYSLLVEVDDAEATERMIDEAFDETKDPKPTSSNICQPNETEKRAKLVAENIPAANGVSGRVLASILN